MKLFALIFLVGCIAAQDNGRCQSIQSWTPNKAYEFEYHGRLLTGLPSLASHYSGVGMRANVKVFAKDADILVLQVQHPKYVDVNQVLHPKERGADSSYRLDGWNWRNVYLPTFKDVPVEHAQILAKPVEFVIGCNGAVREVTVSRDEPEWSINFKKALIVLFQAKVDSYSWELEENRIEHPSDEGRTAWKVKEESLQGSCENTYQVNELPEYLIKENPELIPLPSKCPANAAERKYFEITRTRNLNSCERRAEFSFYKPGRFNCLPGEETNCGGLASRMSVTRFVVCGSVTPTSSGASGASGISKALRASNIVFQRIINEGEQSVNMMGYNAERFVTGTKQVLMLRSIQDVHNFPAVSQPMKLFDLMYEYDTKIMPRQTSNANGNGMMPVNLKSGRLTDEENGANGLEGKVLSKVNPKTHLSGLGGSQSYSTSIAETNDQIQKLLKEVTDEIIQCEKAGNTEESDKSNINLKLLSIVRGFSIYDRPQDIEQLWERVIRTAPSELFRKVAKNYFIDTLAMAGTPASVEVIIKLIEEDKMTHYQIGNFFMWMPHYIIYPTRTTLEKLYRTIRSEKIQPHTMLRNVAITSFTQLLQQACLSGHRQSSYPTFVTGEFCHPDSRIVQEEWIPFLLGELASARDSNDRNVYLVALGILKHRNIISDLIPYVSGSLTRQVGQEVTELNRLMATYSLANIGSTRPNLVIPLLMTVFSNPTESTEMRIAAFNCLLRMNPSSAVFQRIAAVTQQEPVMDQELLKTINIALYTLGHQIPSERLEPANVELINKARIALRLTKQVNGILPTSGTIYTTDFLKRLGLGYEAFISYVASEASILPKSMYTEVKYVLDQFTLSPLRMGYRFTGSENLYEKLGETLLNQLKGGVASEGFEGFSQGGEWSKIIHQLGGMNGQLKDAKIDAALLVQFFESGAVFLSKEQFNTESLAQKLMPYLKNPGLLKQKIGNEMNVNIQRTFDLAQMAMLVPSDMGFPINMETHSPMTFSVIGKVSPVLEAVAPKLEISGKVIVTGQYLAHVGTVVPFCKDILLTGVNQHSVINIPGAVQLELNIPSQKVSVMVKPHAGVTRPMDMLHFHMYPFTVSQKISDLTPIPEQRAMKYIRSPKQLKTLEAEFGEYLGLKMTSKIETESSFTDMASIVEVLRIYKNPLNMIAFPWTSPALSERLNLSVRQQRFSVIYDPTQSSTKELGFEIRVGCATKNSGESSGKYHTLKVKSSSGPSGVGSNSKTGKWSQIIQKLSPYGVSEKTLGGSTVHPRREQKLKEMISQLDQSERATGVTLYMTTIIKGSRPRTWTSVLSFLGGVQHESSGSMKQKWDIRLERPSGSPNYPTHLCAKGTLKLPILPIWNIHELHIKPIDFVFENKIGMGRASCNEASIVTSGNARVSEQQKEFSRQSPDAKLCQKMIGQGALAAKSSHACETANLQGRTLDTVEIINKFINVPEVVKRLEQRLVTVGKAYLWPFAGYYLAPRQPQGKDSVVSATTFTTTVKIEFQQWARAFNLFVTRPAENLVFKTIHIPYPLNLFVPLKGGSNNLRLAAEKVTPFGDSFMKCSIENNSVRRFDKKTIPFKPDTCFHVLSADMSTKSFAVQAKESSQNKLQTKVLLKNHEILFTSQLEVKIDGNTLALRPYDVSIIAFEDNIVVLSRFPDAIGLDATDMRLMFNGERLEIYASSTMRNKLAGICGASNLNINGRESTGCKYSKSSLEVANNRIQSGSCPQLQQSIKEELEKEKGQCAKVEVAPTKLIKGYMASAGKCTIHKHVTVNRPGQICVSKVPVAFCGPTCKSEQSQQAEKIVPFTCFPEGRLAEHYARKTKTGEAIADELRGMAVSFNTKMEQPRNCVPISGGSRYGSGNGSGF